MADSNSHAKSWLSFATKGLDRRTRRTREALIGALLDLLREKPLNAITVTELTEAADVNRATFYTHYQDLFAMYSQLQDALCEICRAMVDEHGAELASGHYLGLIEDLFRFLDENEQIFDILFSDTADSSFFTSILEVIREACMRNARVVEAVAARLEGQGMPKEKAEETCRTICYYQFDYLAGGAVSILRSWMLTGRSESVEAMVALTNSCIKSLNPHGDYRNVIPLAKQITETARN